MTARTRLVGLALAVLTVLGIVILQRDEGIARDETIYIANGAHYADFWWQKLVHPLTPETAEDITRTWGGPQPTDNNREHPPLMKTLFGISQRIFHDKLGVLPELTAARLPSAILAGVLVYLVFGFALECWGFAAAILASVFTILLPRALFHAGLACFDAPMTTLWFAVVVAYWRGLEREWPWQVGVVFGLALATKHNAILLPFALVPHLAIVARRAHLGWGRLKIVLSLALLGPLVLYTLWPWLWFATFAHVKEWLQFHFQHVHYNYEYLGENWNAPPFPWHIALVTTLFTVPVATLAAAGFGLIAWVRERGKAKHLPGLLLFLSAGVSIGPFLLGSTPVFGAEKHWAPAIPSICICAAVGCVWAARLISRRAVAIAIVGGAVALAGLAEVVVSHPYALTWYNALAGEDAGGADRGMNRQFWGVAAKGVLPELAVRAGGKQMPVYSHDASPAWGYYLKYGELPKNLPDAGNEQAGIDTSKLALVIHELHFNRHDYMIWKAYKTVKPVYVLRAHGVPIVSVYQRP